LQATQAQAQTKACKRASTFPTQEKLNLKISPPPSENKKYSPAQTNTTNKKGQLNSTMTMVYRHGGQERQLVIE
jgi:hypothetical protein